MLDILDNVLLATVLPARVCICDLVLDCSGSSLNQAQDAGGRAGIFCTCIHPALED